MIVVDIIAIVASVVSLAYLLFALVNPERF